MGGHLSAKQGGPCGPPYDLVSSLRLLNHLHIIHPRFHQAGGRGVGGLDQDSHRLAREGAEVGRAGYPDGVVAGGRAQLLEHGRGGRAHHPDAEEIRRRGVGDVGEGEDGPAGEPREG